MAVFQQQLLLDTVADRDSYFDITEHVNTAIKESGIQNGICLVSTPHTTCSVFLKNSHMIKIVMAMICLI